MINIHHIAVMPYDGLYAHGALVIEVAIGGRLVASVLEVVQLIDKTVKEQMMKAPIVVLDGRVPDDRNPDDVLELAQVLRRKGYTVFGKTSGTVCPRWLPECNHVQVMVTNEPWLEYDCNEVCYVPPMEGPLVEPRVGAASKALKNIYIGNKFSAASVFGFLSEAAYPWQITTDAKLQYAVVVAQEGR